MFRKLAFALALVGVLGLPAQATAADIPVKGIPVQYCKVLAGGGLSCFLGSSRSSSSVLSGTAGTGALIVTGFIGLVAVLCAYDIYLKISGQKNWDGSPKLVELVHHGHHHPIH